jgi:SAM-dependent methyltransferase
MLKLLSRYRLGIITCYGFSWYNRLVPKRKIQIYRKSFWKHGASPRALGWKNEEAAEVRFENLLWDLDLSGKTVLDFGCGFGDIIPLLEKKFSNFEYLGVDVVPEFVEAARGKYPGQKFVVENILGKPRKPKFDVVLASGSLNSNFPNNMTFRKNALKTLFGSCRETFAFNMAGGFPQPKNKQGNRVYYADALEILEFCLSLTPKIIFRYNYRPKDFTVVMFR